MQINYVDVDVVRMFTVTKKKSVDKEVPKSTPYKTKWSCKVFEEWEQNRLVKSSTLEPGGLVTTKDFEEILWTRPLQMCRNAISTTGCRSSFKK